MTDENVVRRRCGYAAIPNAALADMRLSVEARGLLALMMSMGDGWVYRASNLQKVCCVGADKYQRMIRELKDANYLVISPKRGEDGRMEGYDYDLIDQPEGGDYRLPEKPVTGKAGHLSISTQEETKKERTPLTPEGESGDLFTANETFTPRPTPNAERKKPEDEFERFWSAYPLKKAKAAAEKNWAKAIKKAAPEIIIAAAERYSQSRDVARGFAKYAQGWLSDERWKDGPEPQPSDPEPARNYGGHRRSQPWGEIVR